MDPAGLLGRLDLQARRDALDAQDLSERMGRRHVEREEPLEPVGGATLKLRVVVRAPFDAHLDDRGGLGQVVTQKESLERSRARAALVGQSLRRPRLLGGDRRARRLGLGAHQIHGAQPNARGAPRGERVAIDILRGIERARHLDRERLGSGNLPFGRVRELRDPLRGVGESRVAEQHFDREVEDVPQERDAIGLERRGSRVPIEIG